MTQTCRVALLHDPNASPSITVIGVAVTTDPEQEDPINIAIEAESYAGQLEAEGVLPDEVQIEIVIGVPLTVE